LAYENPIFFDVALPEAVPRVVVGSLHPLGLVAETEVWRRLLRSYDPALSVSTLLIGPWSFQDLEASLPPSVFRHLEVRPDHGWTHTIQLDKPERSFAMVAQESMARILVVGTPTEETWELFQSYLTDS
jgi:hypothetical protein